MAAGSAQLNYSGRKPGSYDAPAAPRKSGASRPAWQPYEPPKREERREERREVKPLPRYDEDFHPVTPLKIMTPAEVRAIILILIVITAIAFCIVFLSAEAAGAQKDINDLKKGIAQVDDDIANLKIEIEQAQNMQLIKDRAYAELGMKEPSFEQYVYIDELPAIQANFGKYIKERAYGGERNKPAEPEDE